MATDPPRTGFDFPAFRTAYETKDVAAWLSFYAEDAESVEDRHVVPRAPHRMARSRSDRHRPGRGRHGWRRPGRADEVIGAERVAFAVTAILPSGRRVYQHVILHLRSARVARQVDVEAWD